MKWHFVPQPQNLVETEVTQRDQFRNDEVDLSDTIVREAVQNSLDAATGNSQVKVRFRWINGSDELSSDFMNQLFDGHLGHARSAGIEMDEIDFASPSALIIEDFGTRGLTGAVDYKDDDNFTDFWRRHGRSHKTGRSRGRWGLGKLVYSSCSLLSSFFGITVRDGDPNRYLMGQTVLGFHKHDGIEYPAHAFFSELSGDDTNVQIQVPVRDNGFTDTFCRNFGMERQDRSGLSIAIPFPNPELKLENMIAVGIVNYFYPIITGQLVLEFNDIQIDSANIRDLANRYAKGKISDIDLLFDFIGEVNNTPDSDLLVLKERWIDDNRLDEDDFEPEDLEKIREKFAQKEIVGIKLPLRIKHKTKGVFQTSFSVYVKRPEELSKGHDMYVRGGLTLPGEAKFHERKAFGAMIADDEAVASFLGDAENAAHTRWNTQAEKLRKNYVNPQPKLRVIRNSVLNLYDLLAQSIEEEDEQALKEFFWTDLPDQPGKKGRKGKTPPDIPPIPAPRPKPARITSITNGFAVLPGIDANPDLYPLRCRIRVAYDIMSGNPFKKYNPFDFDFNRKGEISVRATSPQARMIERKPNILEFEINDPDFRIEVTGFDPNRDLKVDLQTLEASE